MKKLIVVLQILVALLVLVGGAVVVKRYRLSHGKKYVSTAYAPITQADMDVMAQVACSAPTGMDETRHSTCSVCPPASGFVRENGIGWTLESVLQGHFSAGKADEALLHAVGCEPHSLGFGGDFLMRRIAGEWTVVRYAPGATATDKCKKFAWIQDREGLICESGDIHQGVATDAVQFLVFDATTPTPAKDFFRDSTFVYLTDEAGNCGSQGAYAGPAPLMQFGKIDSVTSKEATDGTQEVLVDATIERARSVPTAAGVCPTGHRRTYHLAFHAVGDHFEAGDGFTEFAMQKRDDCCEVTINKTVRPGRY